MNKIYRLFLFRNLLISVSIAALLSIVGCRDFSPLKSSKANLSPTTAPLSVQAEHYYSVPNSSWKDVIIYAHGYVNPTTPAPTIPHDEIDGRYIGDIINSLGYAFATTSYPGNGLVVPVAISDVKKLADEFKAKFPQTEHVYLVGVSEGGLITAKVIETYPDTFTGGIAGCGPVGDFEKQLEYFGNFQVLFHYFYPNIEIGNPEYVPDSLITSWTNGSLKPKIESKLNEKVIHLLKVANVPIFDMADIKESVTGLIRYNIMATNDAISKLNGYPFDNSHILYRGMGTPQLNITLNRQILRFHADSSVVQKIRENYDTTGKLNIPLVTVHNTGDPIVPYFHEQLYERKIEREGSMALHKNIALNSYGHCNFTTADLLAAFNALLSMTGKQKLVVSPNMFPNKTEFQDFLNLSQKYGPAPAIVSSQENPRPSFIKGYLK